MDDAKNNFLSKEKNLSEFASLSIDAVRMHPMVDDIRTAYFRDVDKIIHSLSYTRYMDKTQVFSYLDNDHVTKRIIHVTLVSKIARTIGRGLNLNEDLIEAIALGHDIGHPPLGHVGEKILNEISMRELNQMFAHNIQSVRTYMEIEKNNLTIEVLDGIMCHNGEILENVYKPVKKNKEIFLNEYYEASNNEDVLKKLCPMTLEGCIVRISDMIAYIGRDIEDSINIGLLKREDLPKNVTEILGNNNKDIVNSLILDIIEQSINKPYIKLSPNVFTALKELKNYNYKYIYAIANSKDNIEYYKKCFNKMFNKYLKDIIEKNKESSINVFLQSQTKEYLQNDKKRIVIDYIAGMTDHYFMKRVEEIEKN